MFINSGMTNGLWILHVHTKENLVCCHIENFSLVQNLIQLYQCVAHDLHSSIINMFDGCGPLNSLFACFTNVSYKKLFFQWVSNHSRCTATSIWFKHLMIMHFSNNNQFKLLIQFRWYCFYSLFVLKLSKP